MNPKALEAAYQIWNVAVPASMMLVMQSLICYTSPKCNTDPTPSHLPGEVVAMFETPTNTPTAAWEGIYRPVYLNFTHPPTPCCFSPPLAHPVPYAQSSLLLWARLDPVNLPPAAPPLPPPRCALQQVGQDEEGAVTLLCSSVDRGFLYPEEVSAQVVQGLGQTEGQG